MFIFKKHISRRTVLQGIGATVALPLLEAMSPAATAWAQTPAGKTPKRFAFVGFPHGAIMDRWVPTEAGAEFTPGDYVEERAEAYGGKGGIGEIAAEGEAAPSSLGRVLDLALASPRFMTFIDEIEKEAERR